MELGRTGLAALLVIALGCGGDVAPPAGGAGGATLECGTGIDAFEALAPGGTLLVYRGPQGGHHALAGLRAAWPTSRDVKVVATLTLDGEEVAHGGGRVPLATLPDGQRALWGLPVYFLSERVAEAAPGRTAHLLVAVTDPAGPTGRGEIDVVLASSMP